MFTPRIQNPNLAATLILISTAFIAGSMIVAKALGTGAFGTAMHPCR